MIVLHFLPLTVAPSFSTLVINSCASKVNAVSFRWEQTYNTLWQGRTVLPIPSDRCLSVLSCPVCLWRWCIAAKLLDGLGRHLVQRPHCVRWGPSSPTESGTADWAPHFSQFLDEETAAHVYCGQTAGWIIIPLSTEVGLSSGNIVLDGVRWGPSSPPQ